MYLGIIFFLPQWSMEIQSSSAISTSQGTIVMNSRIVSENPFGNVGVSQVIDRRATIGWPRLLCEAEKRLAGLTLSLYPLLWGLPISIYAACSACVLSLLSAIQTNLLLPKSLRYSIRLRFLYLRRTLLPNPALW